MQQRAEYIDERLRTKCIYCGNGRATREHAPSRVFLDSPYPENLPIVAACEPCNNSYSLDEEYVAALIECTLCGSTNGDEIRRRKVREVLERSPGLAARLASARQQTGEGTFFNFEPSRVRRVIAKLARGHAAFELGEFRVGDPDCVAFAPLSTLTEVQREDFESAPEARIWPEVACRAMVSLCEDNAPFASWMTVQSGRYRYLASAASTGTLIRIVISEYLACEVIWHR